MRVAGARRFSKCLFFPKVFDFKPGFKNSVILGLGGNIGDVKKRFNRLHFKLSRDSRFHVVENSTLLINEAFGFHKRRNARTNEPCREANFKNNGKFREAFRTRAKL